MIKQWRRIVLQKLLDSLCFPCVSVFHFHPADGSFVARQCFRLPAISQKCRDISWETAEKKLSDKIERENIDSFPFSTRALCSLLQTYSFLVALNWLGIQTVRWDWHRSYFFFDDKIQCDVKTATGVYSCLSVDMMFKRQVDISTISLSYCT